MDILKERKRNHYEIKQSDLPVSAGSFHSRMWWPGQFCSHEPVKN